MNPSRVLDAGMIPRKTSRAIAAELNSYQLFRGNEDPREDTRDEEIRRIESLVNTWLILRERHSPGASAVRGAERKLQAAIKGSSLFGKILSFAGLNLWVNERSPDGVVEWQEVINL